MDCYDVRYGERIVGRITVEQEGLYMRFKGSLLLPSHCVHRVCAKFIDKSIDLGVLIKEGDRFCINTRIAEKRLGKGQPTFYITVPTETEDTFYEINGNKAFEHIAILENAVFQKRANKRGICIAMDQGEILPAVTLSQ